MRNKLNIQNDCGNHDSYNNTIELLSALSQSSISIVGKVFFDKLDLLIGKIIEGNFQDYNQIQKFSIYKYFNELEKNKLKNSINNFIIDIKKNTDIYKNNNNKFLLNSFLFPDFKIKEDYLRKIELYKGIICFQTNGFENIDKSLEWTAAFFFSSKNNYIIVGSEYKYVENREHEYLHYLYKFFGEHFMDKGLSYSENYIISSLKNEIVATLVMLDVPYNNSDVLMYKTFGDIYAFVEQSINQRIDDTVYLDKFINNLKKDKNIAPQEKNKTTSDAFREKMKIKKQEMIKYGVRYLIDGGNIGGLFVLPPSLRV